ncbi:MAG: helix-turn-helix domain-containing protein [Daejeonella sp.]|uniref:helix-turn-helix transcriptional regulator n=1 Tax=Daejeonella sp. TaxID=2805397 RepID=UPI003C73167C
MDNNEFAKALYKYRAANHLSQKQMGDMLGMSRQSYDRLEKGLRKATYEEFRRCSKAIGWDISAENGIANPINVSPRKFHIFDLKRRFLNGTIDTADTLLEMEDLAEAVDCPELLDWANRELVGYYASDGVPAYRS